MLSKLKSLGGLRRFQPLAHRTAPVGVRCPPFRTTASVGLSARDHNPLPINGDADITIDSRSFVYRDSTIGEIVHGYHRGRPPAQILEDESVFDAITKMTNQNIGAILVRNNKGIFVGILTERDYMTKIAVKGLSSKTTAVKAIMTHNPTTLSSDASCLSCLRMMSERRFRHVPVTDAHTGAVVGMVSTGDLVKSLLIELKTSTEYLHDYVQGKYDHGLPDMQARHASPAM